MTSRKNRLLTQLFAGFSVLILSWGAVGCSQVDQTEVAQTKSSVAVPVTADANSNDIKNDIKGNQAADDENLSTAVFAGGCFWCMEKPFDELPGVVETTSGYTGGTLENPTYQQVSSGGTGHYEAMEVRYDPQQVSYDQLLETFWVNIDPVDSKGQFCDKGDQYRSAIFYETPEQQQEAINSTEKIAERLGSAIATEILPAATFYDAEDYHQNYYQTHAVRYKLYRYGCGRDQRLTQIWGEDAPAHE
ncbi:MAG: peptide-methionine (S)-S-oxide reductase MsrA [Phormidesmis sp.]